MSTQRSSRILLGLVGAATVAALVVPGAAFAKGGKPVDPGPGDETATFNLSVPAIFVGSDPFGLTCGPAILPDGQTPSTGFTLAGYYYVQGENTWQAQCQEGLGSATATAEWGDNLSGDAKLKAGSPIRVELGLFEASETPVAMTGLDVVKLEPSMLDRESPYGTLAKEPSLGVFESNPVTTLATRVWADGTLVISQLDSEGEPTGWAVVEDPASAEINATGKVVFGYNLRVPVVGSYLIEYTFPTVLITGTDAGVILDGEGNPSLAGPTVSLTITVGGGGGGGGGRR